MAIQHLVAAAVACALLPQVTGAKALGPARINYYESWSATRASVASTPGMSIKSAAPNDQTLGFDAFGRRFQLLLQDHSGLIAPLARKQPARVQRFHFYQGRVADRDGSWVRLMEDQGRWRGMISDGSNVYVVEPAADVAAEVTAPLPNDSPPPQIIYRLSDMTVNLGANFCATADVPSVVAASPSAAPQTALDAFRSLSREIKASAQTPQKQVDVALLEDYEFTSALGADADARALGYMQIVDGIFTSQVGVHIAIASVTDFTSADEPFTHSNSTQLLCEVGNYKSQHADAHSAGIAHLITGRDLDGTIVGIGYTKGLCASGHDTKNCGSEPIDFSSSLSEGLRNGSINGTSYPVSALIAAHEIGHNFGAVHDGDPSKACASTPQTFLMAPQVNGSNQFSQCSLNSMKPVIQGASCLVADDGDTVNVALRALPADQILPLDTERQIGIVVDSNGGALAAGAQVQVDLSGGAQITALSVDGGTCDMSAGSGLCSLAPLSAGSNVTVNVTIKGVTAGTAQLTAAASVPGDSDSGDDETGTSFDVQAGTDLSLTLTAAAKSVVRGDSTSITAAIANASDAEAPAAALDLTVPAGLSLTPPTGCNDTSSGVHCDLGSLAARASKNLIFTAKGTADGAQSVAGKVSTSAHDPDASNDSASVSITVTAPAAATPPPASSTPPPATASSGKSGGGGAFDALSLGLGAMLLAATHRRRRRRRKAARRDASTATATAQGCSPRRIDADGAS